MVYYNRNQYAPVAQLDRASASDAEGCGFARGAFAPTPSEGPLWGIGISRRVHIKTEFLHL